MRWTARGTHQGELQGLPPTGKRVTVAGMVISRSAEGKLVESWEVYDALGMMRHLTTSLWQLVRLGVKSGLASAHDPLLCVPARTSHQLWWGSLLLGTPALLSLGASVWTLPDDTLGAHRMRLSGSSRARPARTFWRRLEPVGWPLAL